ncbi:MAG: hypothetical protein RR373_09130, partial [Akkermansia sp.]
GTGKEFRHKPVTFLGCDGMGETKQLLCVSHIGEIFLSISRRYFQLSQIMRQLTSFFLNFSLQGVPILTRARTVSEHLNHIND